MPVMRRLFTKKEDSKQDEDEDIDHNKEETGHNVEDIKQDEATMQYEDTSQNKKDTDQVEVWRKIHQRMMSNPPEGNMTKTL